MISHSAIIIVEAQGNCIIYRSWGIRNANHQLFRRTTSIFAGIYLHTSHDCTLCSTGMHLNTTFRRKWSGRREQSEASVCAEPWERRRRRRRPVGCTKTYRNRGVLIVQGRLRSSRINCNDVLLADTRRHLGPSIRFHEDALFTSPYRRGIIALLFFSLPRPQLFSRFSQKKKTLFTSEFTSGFLS